MSNILIDGDGLYGQDLAVLRVVFSGIDSKNERERERERSGGNTDATCIDLNIISTT